MRGENKVSDGRAAGAAWVQRFLLPHLARRFPNANSVSCLQIAPDDPTEARRLHELGYHCAMAEPTATMELLFPDSSYDFVFTGRFSVLAHNLEAKITFARELRRILRHGGSLLLAVGNRYCPVDLTNNGRLFHGPWSRRCLSLQEARNILVREAGFVSVVPISVHQHFGWSSLPAAFRSLGKIMDAYWRIVATPSRSWLYASPLNPTLLLIAQ